MRCFGDDVTNELVNWFNAVDATYRADLRELNELNFGRFDAKLGERIAELRADFDARFGRFDAKLGERIAELRADFDARFARFDGKLAEHTHQIEAKLAELKAELFKWILGIWIPTAVAVIGLAITAFLRR